MTSKAPAEVWMRPGISSTGAYVHWYRTLAPDEPDAVRYVRADLYDKRMAENVTDALDPLDK